MEQFVEECPIMNANKKSQKENTPNYALVMRIQTPQKTPPILQLIKQKKIQKSQKEKAPNYAFGNANVCLWFHPSGGELETMQSALSK